MRLISIEACPIDNDWDPSPVYFDGSSWYERHLIRRRMPPGRHRVVVEFEVEDSELAQAKARIEALPHESALLAAADHECAEARAERDRYRAALEALALTGHPADPRTWCRAALLGMPADDPAAVDAAWAEREGRK